MPKRVLQGVVVSDKTDKTITVSANEVHDVSFDFDTAHVAVVPDR